jgi:hypothetical protein
MLIWGSCCLWPKNTGLLWFTVCLDYFTIESLSRRTLSNGSILAIFELSILGVPDFYYFFPSASDYSVFVVELSAAEVVMLAFCSIADLLSLKNSCVF